MSSRSFRRRNNKRKHGKDGQGVGQFSGGRRSLGEGGKSLQRSPSRDEPPMVFPDCPICNQAVRELASALTHRETNKPAHFDCIMHELRESNELGPQEKICYLGGGAFGILEFRQGKFAIRKRIQYEEKDAAQDWKKPLLISL